MKKIINFLLNVFEVPIVLPIMVIYQFYVVFMIVEDSNMGDLYEIETPEELEKHVKPHTDKFYAKYKYIMHGISLIVWLLLIKYIILQIYGV